jgi:Na+/H+ antiporter NhaD/arsenite permease-like protein
MLILGASLVFSGIVNNVPYAATMTPIVANLIPSMHDHAQLDVLWWALVLGTDFGGNLTAVGASANVVIIGLPGAQTVPSLFGSSPARGRWSR